MGLILQSISLSGFGSYGEAEQTLRFGGAGPTAIVGDNGAGKSTAVSKALTWCLYGKCAPERMGTSTRAIAGKSVVNPICKHARVCVRMRNETAEYVITRSRKLTGSDDLQIEVQHDGGSRETLLPTETTIQSIVGVDWYVFTRTVVRGQGDLWAFSEATDKAKRDLLDVISGAFVLEEAEARAIVARKLAEQKAQQCGMLASRVEVSLGSKSPAAYVDKAEAWARHHVADVEQAQAELKAAKKSESAARKGDKGIVARKNEYSDLLDDKPSVDRNEYVDELAKADRSWREADSKHRQAVAEYERLAALSIGDNCPTCGQVVEEAAPIVERQLSSKKVVGEEETNVAPLAKFRDDCSDALNKADVWLSAEMGAWENKLSNFGQIPSEQLPAATRLREEVERRLTTIQATVNPFTEALENEQRAVVDLTREIVLYRAGEAAALTDAILASSWVTVLSAKGVRAHLAESALATIEAEANEWLMVLSCGTMSVEFPATREVKGQTKEEIKTIIKSVAADGSEESRDLLTYSGGERRRINLAVDLGVAAAFSRGGLALSLLVLDEEVFSGMDEHGKAAVVHALHGAGIADVVIVDHDPRLSSTLPRTIRVTRGGDGFSEIEEVSP